MSPLLFELAGGQRRHERDRRRFVRAGGAASHRLLHRGSRTERRRRRRCRAPRTSVRSAHTSTISATCESGSDPSEACASCVNTTTSHAPVAGAVGTSSAGGSWASGVNAGNRLSNTATCHGPAGTSVGVLRDRASAPAGCRPAVAGTCAPDDASRRLPTRPAADASAGARLRSAAWSSDSAPRRVSGSGVVEYRVSARPSGLRSVRLCITRSRRHPRAPAPVRVHRPVAETRPAPLVAAAISASGILGVRSAKSRPFAS